MRIGDVKWFKEIEIELFRLLGFDAAWGGLKATFRDYLSVPSTRVTMCKMSCLLNHLTPHNNAEDKWLQFNRSGSLWCRKIKSEESDKSRQRQKRLVWTSAEDQNPQGVVTVSSIRTSVTLIKTHASTRALLSSRLSRWYWTRYLKSAHTDTDPQVTHAEQKRLNE